MLNLLSLGTLDAQVTPAGLLDKGHYKRARALAEEQYRNRPNDPETLWVMSRVKQVWHDLDESIAFAEKAVAADPKIARYHFRLSEAVGETAQKAGMLHQLGLARRFKKEAEAGLALDPKNVAALSNMMQFYLQAPSIVGGDKAKARIIPGEIMRIDPVQGYFAQISLAQFDKQTNALEGLYRKAVEAVPSSYDAHVALGNYFVSVKKFAEAEGQAREAVKLDPDRVGGHSLLAVTLVQQDKWNELDGALVEGEKAIPDNFLPYFRAANNCLAKGVELPRVERYFRTYLSLEPEPNSPTSAQAHWRLALVLEKLGRKPEAIAELQAAVTLDPNSPAKQDLKRLK